MFFPLRDHNPTRITPWLTYLLIALNLAAFLLVRSRGEHAEASWSGAYGLVPARFLLNPVGEMPTVLTSMFLHGGWLHLGSNLWYLKVFGDNLEESLGRARYLGFYLLCGAGAAAAQIGFDPMSEVPMVGASGAIAGVVGGYMVLYPRAPVSSLNPVPLLWLFLGLVTVLPAWVLALTFLFQNLWMALESMSGMGSAGIAFAAHIGGFAAGLGLVKLFHVPVPEDVWTERPSRRNGSRW
jgi:membrane associated rhomboid family serine protease